jgi:hypothetical protein
MENKVQIIELLDSIYLRERELTSGQQDYIRGCKRQLTRTKELSSKQIATLQDICRHLPAQDLRFSPIIKNDY